MGIYYFIIWTTTGYASYDSNKWTLKSRWLPTTKICSLSRCPLGSAGASCVISTEAPTLLGSPQLQCHWLLGQGEGNVDNCTVAFTGHSWAMRHLCSISLVKSSHMATINGMKQGSAILRAQDSCGMLLNGRAFRGSLMTSTGARHGLLTHSLNVGLSIFLWMWLSCIKLYLFSLYFFGINS